MNDIARLFVDGCSIIFKVSEEIKTDDVSSVVHVEDVDLFNFD